MKNIHEIIDEFYPTIDHVELGKLYCRDKVILILRDYMAQFEQLQQADVSGSNAINRCNECSKELESGTVFCSADCRQHYYH